MTCWNQMLKSSVSGSLVIKYIDAFEHLLRGKKNNHYFSRRLIFEIQNKNYEWTILFAQSLRFTSNSEWVCPYIFCRKGLTLFRFSNIPKPMSARKIVKTFQGHDNEKAKLKMTKIRVKLYFNLSVKVAFTIIFNANVTRS